MKKKNIFLRFIGHFKTITKHKITVGYLCFKCGMWYQGFMHDWSKYSPEEFFAGVKYFQGFRSPIDAEKEAIGYSLAWLHHKGRNKHHWEYWIDKTVTLRVLDMPTPYLIETVLDRLGASKVYYKNNFSYSIPYDYFNSGTDKNFMNPKTFKKINNLLIFLKENGEKEALKYYKFIYKEYKKGNDFLNHDDQD